MGISANDADVLHLDNLGGLIPEVQKMVEKGEFHTLSITLAGEEGVEPVEEVTDVLNEIVALGSAHLETDEEVFEGFATFNALIELDWDNELGRYVGELTFPEEIDDGEYILILI